MINYPKITCSFFRRFMQSFGISICLFFLYQASFAQEQPPKPIKVTVSSLRNLNFGSFYYGNGIGTTVVIDRNGIRSSTGNIILISSGFSAALYDVEALPGTLITIENGIDAILTGGTVGRMTLHIGDSNPQSPFIATGIHTTVTIGGTLLVGTFGDNPPGTYSGQFFVTFNQQ